MASNPSADAGFAGSERAALLALRGVGPTVIARLEQLGYRSLAELRDADRATVCQKVAARIGTTCWRNSPHAIAAIRAVVAVARSPR